MADPTSKLTERKSKAEVVAIAKTKLTGLGGVMSLIERAIGLLDTLADEINLDDLPKGHAIALDNLFDKVEEQAENLKALASESAMKVCTGIGYGDDDDDEQ